MPRTAVERDRWPAAAAPPLGEGEVHVWQVRDDALPHNIDALAAALTSDEWGRAVRFRFPHDRDRFVSHRAVLRHLLGCYLECAPDRVELRVTARGKPELAPHHPRLHFSLSHTDGLALVAFSKEHEVGVDVERVREVDVLRLAACCFHPNDVAALTALASPAREGMFFQYWTRAEASLKATGRGLSGLCPRPEQRTPWSHRAPPGETRHDLPVGPGCRAALAVRGTTRRLGLWEWIPS